MHKMKWNFRWWGEDGGDCGVWGGGGWRHSLYCDDFWQGKYLTNLSDNSGWGGPYTYYMYSNPFQKLALMNVTQNYFPENPINFYWNADPQSLESEELRASEYNSRTQVAKVMKKISRELHSGREKAGRGWRTVDKLVSGKSRYLLSGTLR